jgi:CubicO group peptidase (beta-lactamase class C family)
MTSKIIRKAVMIKVIQSLLLLIVSASVSAEVITTIPPQQVGLSPERVEHIGELVQQYIDENKIAGGVVLLARKGEIAYFEALGKADTNKAMQKDTMFRLASMTKPMVSVAILQLYEQGKFLLSDPVAKYIPEFAHPKVLEMLPEGSPFPFKLKPAKRDITIRDLLAHTAGLPYAFGAAWFPDNRLYQQFHSLYEEAGISGGLHETDGTVGDMVKRLAKLPLSKQPGEAFEYGMATDVLGYLVEVVSGMILNDYMRTHIFEPLKMHDTYFFVPDNKQHRLSALWKTDWNGSLEKVGDGIQYEGNGKYAYSATFQVKGPKTFLSGGAGSVGTPYDYYRFSQMLANKGELDGVRILSRKTVELMTATNHIGGLFATTLHDEGWKFGLGVAIQQDRGHNVDAGDIGVFEWAGIFSTRFSINPTEETILIFMSQTTPFFHHFELWDKLLVLSSSSIDD